MDDHKIDYLEFYKYTLTTVIARCTYTRQSRENEINFDIINRCVIGKFQIYNSKEIFEIVGVFDSDFKKGNIPFVPKVFRKTIKFCCVYKEKAFSIRWFYGASKQKIHAATGFRQEFIANILISFCSFYSCKNISIDKVMTNGLGGTLFGIDLFSVLEFYKNKENLTFRNIKLNGIVYTPNTHAALKIYFSQPKGTVSLHRTGKVLFMGIKDESSLQEIYNYLNIICRNWNTMKITNI